MFELFLNMIKDVSEKLFTKETLQVGKEKKYISALIKNIMLLNDLKIYLIEFKDMWKEWKQNFSKYPLRPDKKVGICIGEILRELMKNFDKVRKLLICDNNEITWTYDFQMAQKYNIFQIWYWIAKKNDECLYEYDRKNFYLYIPNYSLLLNNAKPVSKATDEERKALKKVCFDDYSMSYSYELISKYYIDIPYEYIPLLKSNCYAHDRGVEFLLKIKVPDEINFIDEIISYTEEAISKLESIIEYHNKILGDYVGEDKKNIIKYL